MKDLTIVTGFWNIRIDRNENIYLKNFENLLELNQNMVIFIPKVYEQFVLKKRENLLDITKIVILELDDIRNVYFNEYWNTLQDIRTNPDWYNLTNWIKNTPQYFSEWYNPIVMSKVFFLKDACNDNFFNTNKFVWMDAGITQHISKDLVVDSIIDEIPKHIKNVLFTSIPYVNWEIHGFHYDGYKKYTDIVPNWLCRATIFGCDINCIDDFVNQYRFYLKDTLECGYLGTEESIFTLLTCIDDNLFQRYHMENTNMPDVFLKNIKM